MLNDQYQDKYDPKLAVTARMPGGQVLNVAYLRPWKLFKDAYEILEPRLARMIDSEQRFVDYIAGA